MQTTVVSPGVTIVAAAPPNVTAAASRFVPVTVDVGPAGVRAAGGRDSGNRRRDRVGLAFAGSLFPWRRFVLPDNLLVGGVPDFAGHYGVFAILTIPPGSTAIGVKYPAYATCRPSTDGSTTCSDPSRFSYTSAAAVDRIRIVEALIPGEQ